jgi:hypothetical protein
MGTKLVDAPKEPLNTQTYLGLKASWKLTWRSNWRMQVGVKSSRRVETHV